MQCNSPFFGSGIPNYRQFHPCNFSYPHHTIHPEVIGEGEVASVVFPDGSIHFYFIPTNKRSGSYYDHDIPHYPYWNNGAGAFYIRSVSNPISAAVFNQQYQKMYGTPLSRPCLFTDCNVHTPSALQLKFHNDTWTSTTDLHYFYPRFRECEGPPDFSSPMECTAVQTDIPAEGPNVCHFTCAKPCFCTRDCNVNKIPSNKDIVDECSCSKVHKNQSRTSMSSGRGSSRTKLRKKKSTSLCSKHKPKKMFRKKSDAKCGCRTPCTTDKSVTTYADQASSCTAAERNTQTCPINYAMSFIEDRNCSESKCDNKTDSCFPNSSRYNKPVIIKSSEKFLGVFETDDSSASCCCSATDTDATVDIIDFN